jgi:hypothetical protein
MRGGCVKVEGNRASVDSRVCILLQQCSASLLLQVQCFFPAAPINRIETQAQSIALGAGSRILLGMQGGIK